MRITGDMADDQLSYLTLLSNSTWPNQTVPKDRTKRKEIQEAIEGQTESVWGQCDDDFYEYPDDIAGLLLEYVRQHKVGFE